MPYPYRFSQKRYRWAQSSDQPAASACGLITALIFSTGTDRPSYETEFRTRTGIYSERAIQRGGPLPETPPHPLTLDGSSVLHQMFRFDWPAWRRADTAARERALSEVTTLLAPLEKASEQGHPNQSAIFAQLGHKGDLLFVHYRDTIEDLAGIERDIARTEFGAYLQPQHSYLSLVELGLYESSLKLYAQLASEGIEPYSEQC